MEYQSDGLLELNNRINSRLLAHMLLQHYANAHEITVMKVVGAKVLPYLTLYLSSQCVGQFWHHEKLTNSAIASFMSFSLQLCQAMLLLDNSNIVIGGIIYGVRAR